jgi:5-methylcytosine-specific restriction protein A
VTTKYPSNTAPVASAPRSSQTGQSVNLTRNVLAAEEDSRSGANVARRHGPGSGSKDPRTRIPARFTYGPAVYPDGIQACRVCGGYSLMGEVCSYDCTIALSIARNPIQARRSVAARDAGVCAECGLDCADLDNRFLPLSIEERAEIIAGLGRKPLTAKELARTLWNMDHIIPVAEGGGGCGLDNLRTLCVWCHKVASAALFKRLDHSWSEERRESARRSRERQRERLAAQVDAAHRARQAVAS